MRHPLALVRPLARRTLRTTTLALTLAALSACDLPTSAPQFESSWGLKASTDTVTLASLLPSSVTSDRKSVV